MKFIKRNFNILLITLILIFFLLFNIYNRIFNLYNILLLLVPLTVISLLIIGYVKDNFREKTDIILTLIIFWIAYYLLTYIFGYFIGFVKNPYLLDIISILKNIFPVVLNVIFIELLRYILIQKNPKNYIILIIVSITFCLYDVSLRTDSFQLSQSLGIYKYISTLILPSLFKNFLLSYITIYGGWKSTIIYKLFDEIPSYIIPIIPNFGYYLESMLKIIFPVLVYFGIRKNFEFRQLINPRKKNYDKLFYIISISLIIFIITLTTGVFNYYGMTIATNSMYPKIKVGDVVVVEKNINDFSTIKEGDIIAFKKNGLTITHRVYKILKNGNNIYFQTKGDNNDSVDVWLVYSDEIEGIVRFTIPYIGLPSVWLKERKS